eukprot:gnl/TRDRNA2_/TRDRNA2_84138_c0_seq1.p1 gnl/TRDRNA2_/TRDRNA2_84138_c0~~gnl/TRDRNA2_/TRDRNA2_84138_c0_seq1.p1  ORF type:complete len:248 (-),score=91.64 gnl/TRDRNA2_/TRDRNA2_84138_c0_seq1:56-799(-)
MQKVHEILDVDANGKVSIEEMLAHQKKMRKEAALKDISMAFEDMDADNDGKISLAETMNDMQGEEQLEEDDFAKAQKKLEEEKFHASDKDKDGFLSAEELSVFMNPDIDESTLDISTKHALQSKDLDGDGLLNTTEFWLGDMLRTMTDMEDPPPEEISDEEVKEFEKLDSNGDGKIDLKELRDWESGIWHVHQAVKAIIETADSDHDGHVTAEELKNSAEMLVQTEAGYQIRDWHEHHQMMLAGEEL